MFLEPFKERLDLLEDDDERILVRDNILCGLYGSDIRSLRARETPNNSYRKEDTNASENDIRG